MSANEFDTDDRGRARYFHGRQRILASFSRVLRRAISKNFSGSGTIFLIQGAPGAGKTALLYRFRDIAETGGAEVGDKKWRVVRIGISALYNPAKLMGRVGKTYKSEEKTEWSGRAEIGIRGFFRGGGARKTSHVAADADMLEILDKLASRRPILLVLDEVQALENKLDSHDEDLLVENLEHIHNGEFENPVVLACGGLSISRQVFARLRISRFKRNCLVNIGRLSEANERAVIRDWLVNEGESKEADIQPWITTIVQETYGWPQHIMIYAQTAAELLKARKGQVTQEDLDLVLEDGRAGKRDYYRQRSDFLSAERCRALAYTIQDTSRSEGFGKKILLEGFVDKGEMSQEEAVHLFQELLHKGVLSRVESDFEAYDILIPSMKDHLLKAAGLKV